MSHTPAPWKQTDRFINEDDGEIIVYGADEDCVLSMMCTHIDSKALEKKRANARRIVACVNACENISTEDIEGGVIGRREKFFFDYGDIMAELQTLKDVNELLRFENERMQAELAQKGLDRSKEHSEWILGKWNEDAKVFDATRKTDAEKARMLLGKLEYVEQPAPDPKLKYATWDSLDKSMNFQAYDMDGWLVAYEKRPWLDGRTYEWRFSSGKFTVLYDEPNDGEIPNWQQTLIERPTEQDGPTEQDPSDLAHDHNAITYGADGPSEYDPS